MRYRAGAIGLHLWEYPLTEFMAKVIMVPFPADRQAELNYLYYDANVRDWIARRGPQTREPMWMDGADLTSIYPICVAQAGDHDRLLTEKRLPQTIGGLRKD